MKHQKGLYGLLNDCKHPYAIHKKNKAAKKDSPFEDAQIIEAQSTEEEYFDYGEPLTMSWSGAYTFGQSFDDEYYEDYSYEEDDNHDQAYEPEDYTHEQAYGQEDYGEEVFDGDSEAFYVEPFESAPIKGNPIPKKPTDNAQIPSQKKKQEEAEEVEYLPEKAAGKEKPTIDISSRNIEDDIREIMKQQKEYDTFQKKKAQPEPENTQSAPPQAPSSGQSIDDVLKNEHQIFDKIAQSMKMANAYDLGSIALEQRLDSFEQEMKEEEKKKNEQPGINEPNGMPLTAKELSTDEFLTDLDKMSRHQMQTTTIPEWEETDELAESQASTTQPAFTAGDNKIKVYKDTNNKRTVLHYQTEMAVEGDGAPEAYHPDRSKNGGGIEGWGNGGIKEVVREKGKYYVHGKGKDGKPYAIEIDEEDTISKDGKTFYRAYIQGSKDPAPGYFFSTTALVQGGTKPTESGRYVDASTTPFISFTDWSKFKKEDAEKGDYATIYCCQTKKLVHAVVGDVGGGDLGEGSMFLAKELLGTNKAPTYTDRAGNTRLGTVHKNIIYIVYPNSGSTSQIPSNATIKSTGQHLFDQWGGLTRLQKLYPECK